MIKTPINLFHIEYVNGQNMHTYYCVSNMCNLHKRLFGEAARKKVAHLSPERGYPTKVHHEVDRVCNTHCILEESPEISKQSNCVRRPPACVYNVVHCSGYKCGHVHNHVDERHRRHRHDRASLFRQ